MHETDKILLDTFKLEDKYNLPLSEIAWRALDCAERRAELMGWWDIEIKLIKEEDEGDITKYEFEIWGYENEKEKEK